MKSSHVAFNIFFAWKNPWTLSAFDILSKVRYFLSCLCYSLYIVISLSLRSLQALDGIELLKIFVTIFRFLVVHKLISASFWIFSINIFTIRLRILIIELTFHDYLLNFISSVFKPRLKIYSPLFNFQSLLFCIFYHSKHFFYIKI